MIVYWREPDEPSEPSGAPIAPVRVKVRILSSTPPVNPDPAHPKAGKLPTYPGSKIEAGRPGPGDTRRPRNRRRNLVPHGGRHLIAPPADPRSDHRAHPARISPTLGHRPHQRRHNTTGHPPPPGMRGPGNPRLRVRHQHTRAVGGQHPEREPGRRGEARITGRRKLSRRLRSRYVPHIGAVYLAHPDHVIRGQPARGGHQLAIMCDIAHNVARARAHVQRLIGRLADAALAPGKRGLHPRRQREHHNRRFGRDWLIPYDVHSQAASASQATGHSREPSPPASRPRLAEPSHPGGTRTANRSQPPSRSSLDVFCN